jgi:hypothetical protein
MNSQKILLFRDVAETLNISVHFEKGTFWLTQKAMSELFGVKVPAISKHLNNIFETNELSRLATISILKQLQPTAKITIQSSIASRLFLQLAVRLYIVEIFLDKSLRPIHPHFSTKNNPYFVFKICANLLIL